MREGNSTATAAGQSRKGVVVFAVSAESGTGNMDAVVIVDGKQLRAPYSDEQKDRQKSFADEYFAPGKVYRLIFAVEAPANVPARTGGTGGHTLRPEVTPAPTRGPGAK